MLAELTATVLAAVCTGVTFKFNTIVSEPYMDEIFHIPQAQLYCVKNFSHWDPMITTPPGLYFSSFLIHTVLHNFGLLTPDLCTLTFLRGLNIVFTVLLFFIIHSLLKGIHGKESLHTVLSATNLTIFPVLFFFTFLYYTDVGATLFVLTGYLLATRDYHLVAAVSLLVSLCFRQTCVVWLVFVMATVVIRDVESAPQVRHYKDKYWDIQYPIAILRYLISHTPKMLRLLWPYMVVTLFFLLFVFLNGSVALGDKKHHTITFHVPQLFYFLAFTLALSPSHLLDLRRTRGFLAVLARNWKRSLCAFAFLVVLMSVAVHLFTYTHPYLLADNRHYPFYVWKNIFRRHAAIKYLLVPLYGMAALYLAFVLSSSRGLLWLVSFAVCCFVSLVPQKLLEFRYFILPFLVYRIHAQGHYRGKNALFCLLAELVCYVVLNVATIWVFLYKPFKWPDSGDWQRFMW